MRGRKRRAGFVSGAIGLMAIVFILFGGDEKKKTILAEADGFYTLKKILESPGEAKVLLKGDIRVKGTIHVRGKKELSGGGHCIWRADSFGGTLFSVQGEEFVINNTEISGEGVQKKTSVYGRLVEIQKGLLIMKKKCRFVKNCNTQKAEEGGGAILVTGGKLIMKAGEIRDNSTVTEGAAVFIKKNGSFYMKGGVIRGNKSRGIGEVEGFDGRGGALYNRGYVEIAGGTVRDNAAVAFQGKKVGYGGAGGMLFNAGKCEITGGTMEKNRASYGGAIYNDKNAVLHITGGSFRNNQAERGKTIFFCGKSGALDLKIPSNEIDSSVKKSVLKDDTVVQNPEETVKKSKKDLNKKKDIKKKKNERGNKKEEDKQTEKRKEKGQTDIKPEMETEYKKNKNREMEKANKSAQRQDIKNGVQKWQFRREDFDEIKQYIKSCVDPFSEKANDGFLQKFSEKRVG